MREQWQPIAHGLMRIVVGFAFWTHGAQKLLGLFGGFGPDGGTVDLATRFGAAGVIEFVAGLLIMLGLLTRPAAFIASGEMAVAYFWMHVPRGFWPWQNGGELAAIFSFVFLFLAAAGPGALAMDGLLRRRGGKTNAP
jgi:putative oxidoreductase